MMLLSHYFSLRDRDFAGSNLQRYEIITAVLQSDPALKGEPAVSP